MIGAVMELSRSFAEMTIRTTPRTTTRPMLSGHTRLLDVPGRPAALEARATFLDDDALPMSRGNPTQVAHRRPLQGAPRLSGAGQGAA